MSSPPSGRRLPANYRRCSVCAGWKTNKGMKLKPKRICADCQTKEKT
jgi:hypothetical protein